MYLTANFLLVSRQYSNPRELRQCGRPGSSRPDPCMQCSNQYTELLCLLQRYRKSECSTWAVICHQIAKTRPLGCESTQVYGRLFGRSGREQVPKWMNSGINFQLLRVATSLVRSHITVTPRSESGSWCIRDTKSAKVAAYGLLRYPTSLNTIQFFFGFLLSRKAIISTDGNI